MEHHKDDKKWIESQLSMLNAEHMRAAITGYSKVYLDTMERHKGEIAEVNLARRFANTRLREYVEKCVSIKKNPYSTEKPKK